MRELVPRKAAPPRAVLTKDGEITPTPLAIRRRWQEFFSDKLGGAILGADALFSDYVTRFDPDSSRVPLEVAVLPTLRQVCAILRGSKPRRGHGEDSIGGELYRRFPELLGGALYPVWVKALVRVQEPLAWKGGVLVELLKPTPGDPRRCES